MMQLADFEDLLDRLGEDISVWPEPQRQPAADLLLASQQARDLLSDAKILRQALSAPPVRADRALFDRIMQRVSTDPPLPPEASSVNPPADVAAPQPRGADQTDSGAVDPDKPDASATARKIADGIPR